MADAQVLAEAPGLAVRRGDVVLLRGPNGSGKTSLLRALAGLPPPLPQPGVRVLGLDPTDARAPRLQGHYATQEARDGLVGLTVRGEFALRGQALPDAVRTLADQPVATLSSGQARRVALAACAAPGRPLLLLDEPAEGLDAAGRSFLLDLVRSHARRGAVVAADHSGTLAAAATRTLDLGRSDAAAAPGRMRAGTEPVLRVPPCTLPFAPRPLPPLTLPAGLHAVAGPNGSGKSTLLRAIAGLLPGCRATVDGAPVRPGGNLRLMLPHAKDTLRGETVREALGAHAGQAAAWGVQGLLERHPLSLSGGQAQRAALAKALAPAQVHLLDEPEAHLDAAGRALLWTALGQRVAAGACVLVATHDPALLAACHSRTVLEAP
ncbi:MAG TPA: ATP-binding cassette domain-containing protein [Candidatus Thermoplasmatota archaeon]|nr:ATP-binding cassette domain-containing protein [Candidatus Thermoplasmatota archaeon]